MWGRTCPRPIGSASRGRDSVCIEKRAEKHTLCIVSSLLGIPPLKRDRIKFRACPDERVIRCLDSVDQVCRIKKYLPLRAIVVNDEASYRQNSKFALWAVIGPWLGSIGDWISFICELDRDAELDGPGLGTVMSSSKR